MPHAPPSTTAPGIDSCCFATAQKPCVNGGNSGAATLPGGAWVMKVTEDVANSIAADTHTASPIRILCVEDDSDFREALAGDLTDLGFLIQVFPDGASLLQALDQHTEADIVILDWTMPRLSGIQLLSELRQRGIMLPVVFLTGQNRITREKLANAFEQGAIDFVGKERGVDVLARRLRVAVQILNPRMTGRGPDKRYICGKLVLDPLACRASWGGADVGLSMGEYKIVRLLASNVGRAVSNRAIYDKLHYEGFIAGPGTDGYRANVRSYIKRIRKKFLKLDPTFAEIEAFAGFGYCWRSGEASSGPGTQNETEAKPP
jgi:two-component system, OmpR family, response regulator ChvI